MTRIALLVLASWLVSISPTPAADPNPDEGRPVAGTGQQPVRFAALFNGQDFQGWKQTGNWTIAEGAFYCSRVVNSKGSNSSRNNLYYVAGKLPGDCELVFEWKESGETPGGKANGCGTGHNNPGFGISHNIGGFGYNIGGVGIHSTYGAAIDYSLSGIDIRLHTRSLDDASPTLVGTPSGFLSKGSWKDFSKPIGRWNRSRILCQGSKIQFWLNGNRAYDLDLASREAGRSSRRTHRTWRLMIG